MREIRGQEVGGLEGYELVGADGEVVRTLSIDTAFPLEDEHGAWTGETRFEAAGLHVAKTELRTLVTPRPATPLALGTRHNVVSLHRATGELLFELHDVPWLAAGVAGETGDVALLARSERGMPATPDELRVVASDGRTVRLELREAPRTLWNVRLSPRGTWLAYTLREPGGGPPLAVRARHVPTGERFELPARDDLELADFSEIGEDGVLIWIEYASVQRPGGQWDVELVRRPVGRVAPGGQASARTEMRPELAAAVAEGGRFVAPHAFPYAVEFRRADGTRVRRLEVASGRRFEGERWGGDEIQLRTSPRFVLVTRRSVIQPEPATRHVERIHDDLVNTVSLHDPEGRTLFELQGVRWTCVALADDGDANVCVEQLPEGGSVDDGWQPGMRPEHDEIVVLGRDGAVRTRIEEPPVSLTADRVRISRNGRWLSYFAGSGFGPPRPTRTVVVDLATGARHEIEVGSLDPLRSPDRISDDGDLLELRGPGAAASDADYDVIWQRPR